MSFTSPLSVYIVWHPKFAEGAIIANKLYSIFCRDIDDTPIVRKLGIPVYFRSRKSDEGETPIDIAFEESEYNAIVVLLSAEFLTDANYKKYLENIISKQSRHKKTRIFPVAFHPGAYHINEHVKTLNFIKADAVHASTKAARLAAQISLIRSNLMHELCRMMLHTNAKGVAAASTAPPVKIFISYSNHDHSGADAEQFKHFIDKNLQLKTFFAPNDIGYGIDFGDEIKRAAGNSALVVFHSDTYADREWCRIEIITAKSAECPVVVINNVEKGESRTFPYLGNYPSLRLARKKATVTNFQNVVDVILEQVLFKVFMKNMLSKLADIYKLDKDFLLFNYPELFDFISLKKKAKRKRTTRHVVLYPDPPLGTDEINILKDMDSNYSFITPVTLHSRASGKSIKKHS